MRDNSIIQGSEAWLEVKQKTIGGSEIYTLVYHYCFEDLKALGFSDEQLIKDRPFRTIQELFLKVKFGAKLDDILPVHKVFGNSMEEYIARRLEKKMPNISVERTKDFIMTDGLASSSPDARITIKAGSFPDYDNKNLIDASWGKGGCELKTSSYFSKFSKGGTRLQYIFQKQHNMLLDGDLKFGILTAINPKVEEVEIEGVLFPSDGEFAKCRSYMWASEGKFNLLDELYDLQVYVYPKLPAFQAMIIKSLNLFQEALDKYDEDQSYFPRNSEDLAGLEREKKLWAQLWPEKFGTFKIAQGSKLDMLLDERYQAQVESMFADQAKVKAECEIMETIKYYGLGKYTELCGSNNRAAWTKNGQIRFCKLKESKI